jgi:hypothetical protein
MQLASALEGGGRINTPTVTVHLSNKVILDPLRKPIGAHFKSAGEADMARTLENFNVLV